MPRWLRVARGMIGTGLTFAAGVGAAVSAVGVAFWFGNGVPAIQVLRTVGKFSVVAFLLGVVFSGVLALVARGRQLNRLSLRLVAGLGAGAGFLYWVFLAMNGGRTWTPRLAVMNFTLLIVMGGVSATAMLLIARRAVSSTHSIDEPAALGEGDAELYRHREAAEADRATHHSPR